jgi:hypothetical protein
MIHDFHLVSREDAAPEDYLRFAGRTGGARLENNLFEYIADSLAWVPSFNPSTRRPQCGLNQCGVTVIDSGAPEAAAIFAAWAGLFSLAPEVFTITGASCIGPAANEARYERLQLSRHATVGALKGLASLFRRVTEGTFVLHCGL